MVSEWERVCGCWAFGWGLLIGERAGRGGELLNMSCMDGRACPLHFSLRYHVSLYGLEMRRALQLLPYIHDALELTRISGCV